MDESDVPEKLLNKLEKIIHIKRYQSNQNSSETQINQNKVIDDQKRVKRLKRFKKIQECLGLNKIKKKNFDLPTVEIKKNSHMPKNDIKEVASLLEEQRLKKQLLNDIPRSRVQSPKLSVMSINSDFNIPAGQELSPELEMMLQGPLTFDTFKKIQEEILSEKKESNHELYKFPQQSEQQEFQQFEYLQSFHNHQTTIKKQIYEKFSQFRVEKTLSVYEPYIKSNKRQNYTVKLIKNLKPISFKKDQNNHDEEDQNAFYQEELNKINLMEELLQWSKENIVTKTDDCPDWNNRKLQKLLQQLGINLENTGPINAQFIEKILNEEAQKKAAAAAVQEKVPRKKNMKRRTKQRVSTLMEERLERMFPETFGKSQYKLKTQHQQLSLKTLGLKQENRLSSQNNMSNASSPKKQKTSFKYPKISFSLSNIDIKQQKLLEGRFKSLIDKMNFLNFETKQQNQHLNELIQNMAQGVDETQEKYVVKMDLGYLKHQHHQ